MNCRDTCTQRLIPPNCQPMKKLCAKIRIRQLPFPSQKMAHWEPAIRKPGALQDVLSRNRKTYGCTRLEAAQRVVILDFYLFITVPSVRNYGLICVLNVTAWGTIPVNRLDMMYSKQEGCRTSRTRRARLPATPAAVATQQSENVQRLFRHTFSTRS